MGASLRQKKHRPHLGNTSDFLRNRETKQCGRIMFPAQGEQVAQRELSRCPLGFQWRLHVYTSAGALGRPRISI